LSIVPKDGSGSALTALATALRQLPLPVIGRIEKGAFILDLRCLDDEGRFVRNLASYAAH
jgi:L-seryl-tRNA(Ser) seleniumtransferase